MSNDGSSFRASGSAPIFGSPILSGIVGTVSDLALVVTSEGEISAALAKPDYASFQEVADWPGKDLTSLIDEDSAKKFHDRVTDLKERAAAGEVAPYRWVEINHLFRGGHAFPVRYAMHWMADQNTVLMLGLDQRPVIEMQQQLLDAHIALERDYEAQREIDTRYRLLLDLTSDAVAFVSMSTGRIVDINTNAAALLGRARQDLLDTPFAEKFIGRKKDEFLDALRSILPSDIPTPIEVELKGMQRRLMLRAKLFRAAGEQLALIMLNDPVMGTASDGQLVDSLRQLFYQGIDAIVFTDKEGVIEAASETFLNLTDAPGLSSVIGRSVADFLGRGTVDLKVLLDNARRAGHLRMYATKLRTDFDAQLGVEISATWLNDRYEPTLALIIRNASNSATMRSDMSMTEANMRGVMELVGSSTLKDIVSETTNVIEKICIETAIELTRNNRVAAAEMLGLSRQSLYVKLRKYGLLSRDDE